MRFTAGRDLAIVSNYEIGGNVDLYGNPHIAEWFELLDAVEDYQHLALFYLLETCG